MSDNLTGTTVLVVGGAKNLGLAIATRAAELGAHVVIGARDGDAAQKAAATLPGARGIAIDVTDEATIAAAAADLGAIDHIVSLAAAHHNVAVADLDHDRTITAFEAKVIGPLLLAKHFAPSMPASGSIVLFSGVAAWKPSHGKAVMGITNGAVSFTASHLAKELAPIRVNAVSPGIIDSGTWDGMPDSDRAELFDGVAGSIPAGRVGATADIVDAATWLLTAGFVSGETIHVEGGARSA
ncbi:MAG: SDR family oxidoreductase [Corynebacteriales bacterium]|nr:SDR family oxidoreductase [Mycobacteriales bacterium]